jgi:hypothetical protein
MAAQLSGHGAIWNGPDSAILCFQLVLGAFTQA